MTTSQKSFLSEILSDERIPDSRLAYFRGRFANQIHGMVLDEFARRSRLGLINKAQLASRIGREPAQVTRWLGSPGNWTIETLSDLLLAMKCEPTVGIKQLRDASSTTEATINESVVVSIWKNKQPPSATSLDTMDICSYG